VDGDPWKEFNDETVSTFAFQRDMDKEALGSDPEAKVGGSSDAMSDADLTAFLSAGA